jgi:hypothetical protein
MSRAPEGRFSRQRYGTHECPQDRLRAEEMEERLIQSLVATLDRSDLIEEAVARWAAQQGKDKPKLEKARKIACLAVHL